MSEKSFRDRQGKTSLLMNTIITFTPAHNPADSALSTATMTSFISTIDTKNTLVEGFVTSYTTQSRERLTLTKILKATATRIVARLKSNAAWNAQAATAKGLVEKLRGKSAPKAKPPTDGEPPEVTKKRNAGEQAFVEIAALFERLITVATGAPSYSIGVPLELSSTTLTTQLNAFKAKNTTLGTLAGQIAIEQKKRYALYYDPAGLAEKFKSLKEAVKSQYGSASPEYASVKGQKW